MIDHDDFFMGRDHFFPYECTQEIEDNASITIEKVNRLLSAFGEDRKVNSGWRPRAINRATAGAAVNSKHMSGQACDLNDPDGDLDEWCMVHQDVLEEIGLWMEHPASTKGWCHVQTIPPKSGNRVFYP